MSALSDLSRLIPTSDIAQRLGISPDAAGAAVEQALPGLLSGLAYNAQSPSGAASLEKALEKHTRTTAAPRLDDIDAEDGSRIVHHVFGEQRDAVATTLADGSGHTQVSGDLIQKVLPLIAPIVLSWLAGQFFGRQESPQGPASAGRRPQPSPGGGIGDLLGGLLGGGAGGLGGLGGVLGGLLGGGR
jgi:hypothetical protein